MEKTFTLKFKTMDIHGELDEQEQSVPVESDELLPAIREANDFLRARTGSSVSFMPKLVRTATGEVVAWTTSRPACAHWITRFHEADAKSVPA